MKDKTFKYVAFALKIAEKLLGSKFSISGAENIPKKPVLFVCNHFTRSETFFVPYLIHKYTQKQVRCLADSGLFNGNLGKFLNSVGSISTKDKNRDEIIIGDLISGSFDWLIYPEGGMIKSKEIKMNGFGALSKAIPSFTSYTPYRTGTIRTGSAVLALKSQLYRDDLIELKNKNKLDLIANLAKNLKINVEQDLSDLTTMIVPLTISYYPIRPGTNKIKGLINRLSKKIPPNIAEELEVETNLLINSEINLYFGKPVNLSDYVKSVKSLIYQIPIIKNDTKSNFVIKYFKHRLINQLMLSIYQNLQINFDHLFSAVLYHSNKERLEINNIKKIIYLSAIAIKKSQKYQIHPSISSNSIYKLFSDEHFQCFDDVFKLAKSQDIVKMIDDHHFIVNKEKLSQKTIFDEIRIGNTLQVILNEFLLLDFANVIIKKLLNLSDFELRERVSQDIYSKDLEKFNEDYEKYFDEKFSKNKDIGSPQLINSCLNSLKTKSIGILLCHGYKSASKEMSELAKFLSGFGFKIYVARLDGHGTAPHQMQDTAWQDWYNSLQKGYCALNSSCSKIILIGFSTGGLLSLLMSANKKPLNKLAGIIAINSALQLKDLKAKFVSGINLWNELLEKLKIDSGKLLFVDDVPENPHINYSRNYLKGVVELEKLMSECSKNLYKITTPTLVIQGDNDPIVNPISGKIIYDNIGSKNKVLFEPNFDKHVIVLGNNKEEVFEKIRYFLVKEKFL